jgi:hypothetical protein
MQVDVLTLAVTTCVTGAVGWLVKALLDTLRDYIDSSSQWRAKTDGKLDTIMGATQTTMRATLIHNYEKYAERGWLTPEERASWCDMHDKYAAMGFNGLIDTYRDKLNQLPDKEL